MNRKIKIISYVKLMCKNGQNQNLIRDLPYDCITKIEGVRINYKTKKLCIY